MHGLRNSPETEAGRLLCILQLRNGKMSTNTGRSFLLFLIKTMLIDKYLSVYDFNEFHSIKVNALSNGMYHKMLSCDMSQSFLVRLLFRLRGMPGHLYSIPAKKVVPV